MATKIPIGTSAYFTDFDGGQGGGASNYFTYAPDLDTNFLLLRSTVNTIIDEISAVSGPNATIALDLARWDDDANPIDPAEPAHGVIGPASYEVSVEGGGTLKVRKGQALVNLQKVTLIADLTGLSSSGLSGTRWVALDQNGGVYIESAAGQRQVDLATVTWDGAQFTAGTVVHLMAVLPDGDSWAECQDRAVTPGVATLEAYTFRRVASRIRALELFLSGHDAGVEADDIDGPLVLLPGIAATPSLILGDGSTTFDTDSGWYRASAGHWGFSSGGALRYELTDNGIRFAYLGDASTPALRTTLAGLYFPVEAQVALACSGDLCLRCKTDTGNLAQALVADGVVGDPGLGFDQEENTGLYRPGAGQLAVALAGVQRALFDANGLALPDGVVGAPAIRFLSETNTGIYLSAAGEIAIDLLGVKRFHFTGNQMHAPDGVVGTPAYSFDNETDMGMYRVGTDRLGLVTAGNLAAEIDAVGNLDLPLNFGAIVRRAATQSGIVSGTATLITWDTEDEDRPGTWITVSSTTLTVPTDGDGLYHLTLEVHWPSNASPAGYREIWFDINSGTVRGRDTDGTPYTGTDHYQTTTAIVRLVATNTIQAYLRHAQGGNQTLQDARLVVQKIA